MKLVDQYIQEVKVWLPKSQREDIALELADELQSQADERSRELGRELTQEDVEQLLRRGGNPLLVAERFLPNNYLIGPRIFPIYAAALKGLFYFYLLPWLGVWLYMVAFVPSYRSEHLLTAIAHWPIVALDTVAILTAAFAIFDWVERKEKLFDRWTPKKPLASVSPQQKSRFSSIAEVGFGLAWLLWWVTAWSTSWSFQDGSRQVEASYGPLWQYLHGPCFVPALVLILGSIALSVYCVIFSGLSKQVRLIRAALNGGIAVLLGIAIVRTWSESAGLPLATSVVNLGIAITAGITALAFLAGVAVNLYQAFRTARGIEI